MERTPAKRSSLFLLELMIAILFFCLASAVCVQIFVKAHTTSRETQELNTALEKVSGYTELFLADALTEDTEVFYDADWQECSKDEASYEIVIRVEPDGKLLHGTFTVQRLSGEQPEEVQKTLWNKIRQNRFAVLTDSKARRKTRFAAMLSYLGKAPLQKIYQLKVSCR